MEKVKNKNLEKRLDKEKKDFSKAAEGKTPKTKGEKRRVEERVNSREKLTKGIISV